VCSKGDSLVIGPGGIKLHLPLMLWIFIAKFWMNPWKSMT
jgi:hypothetical protein